MLVDTKEFFKCETCRHQKYYGCNTFCDAGEGYSPDVSKLTAVDAVEVVRCKDCLWALKYSCDGYFCMNPDLDSSCIRPHNGFCESGERRNE